MLKLFSLLGLFIISATLQSQVTFDAADLEMIVKSEKESYSRTTIQHRPDNDHNYDVKWYRCVWNIDPAVREISGNVSVLFVPSGAEFDTLVLDLSSALVVDSVSYLGQNIPQEHSNNLLAMHLPATLQPGIPDSVTVYYHGVPPDNGFGAFTRSDHGGTPILWTLSEPYGSSDWWPCRDGLTDKADSMDIYIRTPAQYKAASNGILISETAAGTDKVFHWKHRYPIVPYLVCLAVTNYAEYSHYVPYGSDSLPVVNYVYPEDSAAVSQQTGIIVPMIQLFDTMFGIYPFQHEKYGHAQFGWGGGMEHQTMTFVGSFGFELLAHELAHMWFGNKVTCGSWTDIWLNEGFATYLSGLCYEHLAPVYWKRFREVRVQSIISQPGGSVYCPDTSSVGRIFDGRLSYAKGAMILHQLRWMLGNSAFFAALNNYLHDPDIAFGFARTHQLVSHLEAASGRNLSGYFDDWYTGEGYPSYQVGWTQEGDTMRFTVHQSQSHPSVSFFEMEIPVQFKNSARDTILRFVHAFQGQLFEAILPFTADSVLFDPEYQLISGNNTINAVKKILLPTGLRVFPNPAENRVTFDFGKSPVNDPGQLFIYDPSGRIMAENPVAKGETSRTIDTRKYPPGIYFYRLMLREVTCDGKFVIR